MADILIRMDMPKRCNECPMINCVHDNQGYYPRPDKCPLLELPPHGRLGDLDRLEGEIRLCAEYQVGERQQGILGACGTIRNAPTVIPASEVQDEKR